MNYDVVRKLETGIVLTGAEAKAVQTGKVDLSKSFAKIIEREIYLINALINTNQKGQEARRNRKLLAHKKEIQSLVVAMKVRKLTLAPLSMYTKGRLVKIELGLVRSRRKHEKREALKRRDIERDMEREAKDFRRSR